MSKGFDEEGRLLDGWKASHGVATLHNFTEDCISRETNVMYDEITDIYRVLVTTLWKEGQKPVETVLWLTSAGFDLLFSVMSQIMQRREAWRTIPAPK